MKRSLITQLLKIIPMVLILGLITKNQIHAQSVTNAQILGIVTDEKGEPLVAATVQAKHIPSGTIYGVYTREDGRFNIPNMRVGGPYTVTVNYIGYKNYEEANIYLSLGQNLTAQEVLLNRERALCFE